MNEILFDLKIQYLIPCTYTIKPLDTRNSNISFTTTTYKMQHFSQIQRKTILTNPNLALIYQREHIIFS
jgi:hypothetical protein